MKKTKEKKFRKNVKRPPCPSCGSRKVAWIQWGRPIWRENLREQLDRREIVLGSCFISESSESWRCNDCGHRFGNADFITFVMKHKKQPVPDYIAAHIKATMNETMIESSNLCACFHCRNFFVPTQTKEWIEDIHNEKTALCPYCGSDSVVGDEMDYPLSEELIRKMHIYWFGKEESTNIDE